VSISNSIFLDRESMRKKLSSFPHPKNTRIIHSGVSRTVTTLFPEEDHLVPGHRLMRNTVSFEREPGTFSWPVNYWTAMKWSPMPSSELVELLGSIYNITPFFFTQLLSNVERELIVAHTNFYHSTNNYCEMS
jgi:hypothetical protein